MLLISSVSSYLSSGDWSRDELEQIYCTIGLQTYIWSHRPSFWRLLCESTCTCTIDHSYKMVYRVAQLMSASISSATVS